jgi:hypothetical protein
MFQTSGGSPYTTTAPTIDIYTTSTGAQIVTAASMTQIGTTALYKYDFTTGVFGTNYAYIITGNAAIPAGERYAYGSVFQDTPDRIYGTVVANGGNTTSTFQTSFSSSTTDFYKDAMLVFTTGNQTFAPRKITAYNGTTFFVTVNDPLPIVPSASDQFLLIVI